VILLRVIVRTPTHTHRTDCSIWTTKVIGIGSNLSCILHAPTVTQYWCCWRKLWTGGLSN